MAKNITFTFEDIDYTLEFTRKSVQEMEKEGFVAANIDIKPMNMLPMLFAGAFKARHRFTKKEVIDRIYAAMPGKELLIEKLIEMYNETLETLTSDPEDPAKNVEWVPSW